MRYGRAAVRRATKVTVAWNTTALPVNASAVMPRCGSRENVISTADVRLLHELREPGEVGIADRRDDQRILHARRSASGRAATDRSDGRPARQTAAGHDARRACCATEAVALRGDDRRRRDRSVGQSGPAATSA